MKAILLIALSLFAVPAAQAQQFYDVKHPNLEAFEFKLACKTTWHKDHKYFSAELSGNLTLSLQGGASLVFKSDYFRESAYDKNKDVACSEARKAFFADNLIREYVELLEAIRTRTPILNSNEGRGRCALPLLRVFREPGQTPVEMTEAQWILQPVNCPN